MRVLIGACDPLATPRPLGPIVDIAASLGGDLERALDNAAASAIVCFVRCCASCRRTRPTVLVLEDVHWADEATLDLLRFVGRRVGDTRGLVVATFRDDEVGPDAPAARRHGRPRDGARGAPNDAADAVRGSRSALVEGSGLNADELFRQTGGNPFFVTEVLASSAAEPIPSTVRDAVLARAGRLSAAGRAALDAAAVIGPRVEDWLLTEIVGAPSAADECVARGVLLHEPHGFAFRHELARQAVLEAMPPARQTHPPSRACSRRCAVDRRTRATCARLAHHADAGGGPRRRSSSSRQRRRARRLRSARTARRRRS